MTEDNNYKLGLLYFYWLMAGADGERSMSGDDPEWEMMQKMRKFEGISDEELERFLSLNHGREEEQFKKILYHLVVTGHVERVRALAWMDLVMFADGFLHDNEKYFFEKVRGKFDVDDVDIQNMKAQLIEATS
jgi:hypothetical protein